MCTRIVHRQFLRAVGIALVLFTLPLILGCAAFWEELTRPCAIYGPNDPRLAQCQALYVKPAPQRQVQPTHHEGMKIDEGYQGAKADDEEDENQKYYEKKVEQKRGKWRLIGEDSEGAEFIEKDTLSGFRPQITRTIWRMQNYKGAGEEIEGEKVLSMKMKMEYDCFNRRFRSVFALAFTKHGGKGKFVWGADLLELQKKHKNAVKAFGEAFGEEGVGFIGGWESISPKTNEMVIWDTVCK